MADSLVGDDTLRMEGAPGKGKPDVLNPKP